MGFSQHQYDYVIAGAGCAGLSLAWNILNQPSLSEKNIAIIGSGPAQAPLDKTWCFWMKDQLPEPVPIYKSWNKLEIFAGSAHIQSTLKGMAYHCVRSEDYIEAMTSALLQHRNLEWIEGPVTSYSQDKEQVKIQAGKRRLKASHFFKCYGPADLSRSRYRLKQHFKGVEIVSKTDRFDPDTARMMDFRVPQKGGATFFYVLPYTSTHALVEYTLFSPDLLDDQEYDQAIHSYIQSSLHIPRDEYEIIRTEFGVIPMADRMFKAGEGARVHYVGTVSGIPKASTGYAFSRIHRQTHAIAQSLVLGNGFRIKSPSSRKYRIYDAMMLEVLSIQPPQAVPVFEALFTHNPVERVLRFIDEQSRFGEDLMVMKSVPRLPFLKAAVRNAGLLLKGV